MRKSWIIAMLCAAAAVAAFFPVLRAEFVWDDSTVQNLQVPRFGSVGEAFRPPRGMVEWADAYYRPLVTLTYLADEALNNAFAGVDPPARTDPARARIPHATTLLIHTLCAAAAALLAFRCLRGAPAAGAGALAAGLFFALTPAHGESVATVAGRSDSLATLFLLFALLAALAGRDRRNPLLVAGGALLFLAALLAKEVAAAGLLILPFLLWWVPPEEKEARAPSPWLALGLFAAAFGAYAWLRAWAGTGFGPPREMALAEAGSRLLRAFGFYVRKMLFPWPMDPFVPELPGDPATAGAVAAASLLLALAVAQYQKGKKLFLLCFLWFAAACLPSLAVTLRTLAETPVADRYLYLPSVGAALAVGGTAAALAASRRGRLAWLALCVVLALFAVGSRRGLGVWRSDYALWSELCRREDTSRHALPWVNLGHTLLNRNERDEAEQAFRRALSAPVPPGQESAALALNGLGVIQVGRAERLSSQKPHLPEAIRILREAERDFAHATVAGPWDWTIFNNLASCRLLLAELSRLAAGRYDLPLLESAREALETSLRLSPGNAPAQAMMRTYLEKRAAVPPG